MDSDLITLDSNELIMPNMWDCYPHQRTLWSYLDERDENGNKVKGKRAVCVWHRRAGKDATVLNYTACEAIEEVGLYFHMLPTQRQARKVIWDGINRDSVRMIDQAFPEVIRKATRSQEMQIELKNGSIWQLCGSDNYDALVGSNPKGVIFSEWSLCNPYAWEYIRPILAENGGWAIFIFTPRSKNHGWDLYEMALENPDWHVSRFTADDTIRNDGTPIMSPVAIQKEREAGMNEEMIQQEFFCSFDTPVRGAYFAKEINIARNDDPPRICKVPIERHLPVYTFWDLGISKGNAMVVWMVQAFGKEIRVINHIEKEDSDIPWFKEQLDNFANKYGIHYGEHFAPHDISVRDMFSKKSRLETAREMGLNFTRVDRTNDLNDSIETARRLISRCWFDAERCKDGISALSSYHREWDEKRECFKDKPVHDWASNSADAFRQMAQAWNDRLALNTSPTIEPVQMDYKGFNVFA